MQSFGMGFIDIELITTIACGLFLYFFVPLIRSKIKTERFGHFLMIVRNTVASVEQRYLCSEDKKDIRLKLAFDGVKERCRKAGLNYTDLEILDAIEASVLELPKQLK